MVKFAKKLFTMSVVVMTIVWSIGLAAFLPTMVTAATCPTLEAGDLFKIPGNSAVYLVNKDMKRMYFFNAEVYKSWYDDYSGVQEIAATCTDAYPSGGAVAYRPGSKMVKTVISPSVYAVLANGQLLKVADEASAKALYGANWAKLVRDLADVYFDTYTVGTGTLTDTPHNGMLVMKEGTTDVYHVVSGKLYKVDGTLSVAAKGDVRTVSAATFGKLEVAGTTVTAASVVEAPYQAGKTTGTTTTPAATGGDLSVALAADTPAGVNAALGSIYNDVLHFSLKAGSKAVSVTGVTLKKTGLISNTDLSGVSVWTGDVRHGSIATALDDNGTVSLGFGNNPIAVAANSSVTVSVKVNVKTTATQTNFQMGVTAVESNSVSTTGLPVTGNQSSVVAGTLASYTVAAGTVAGYASESAANAADGQFEIGDLQKEVGKWTLAESGNEDVLIEKLTFYIQGTVNEATNLKNWTVYGPANELLGKAEAAADRYVTVPVNYTLKKGYTKTFTLKADVVDGSNKYFAVTIQNDYDVVAKGLNTGYYVAPVSFSSSGYTSTNGWFKLKQGTVSIQKAVTSPSSNVAAGTSDAVLGYFDIKALGEDLEVRKLALEVETAQLNDPDLSGNIKVQSEDGTVTYLSRTYSDFLTATTQGDTTFATGTQWDLSTYMTIKSGQTKKVRVVANVADGATGSDTYLVKVGSLYVKRLSTLDYQSKPNTTTAYPANTLTVQAAALTIAKNTSVGNATIAAGTSDAVLGSIKVQGGSAEDVNLTSLVIDFTSSTYFENVGLWDGTTLLGSEIVSPVNASNSFSFSLTVKKNEVKTITIKGDVKSSASSDSNISTISAATAVGSLTGQNAVGTFTAVTLQTMSFGSASLKISNDSSVLDRILMPGATKQLIATTKYEAVNSDVTLKKVTYSVVNRAQTTYSSTLAGDFGELELRDATGKVLATASVVDDGSAALVTFTGFEQLILAGQTVKLSVYSAVNGSGTLSPASIATLAVTSDETTRIEAYASTGQLARAAVGPATGVSGDDTLIAASNRILFHEMYPIIAKTNDSAAGTKTPAAESELFRFTVNNPGTRDMKLNTTTVNVSVSGLATGGTVTTFKLYDGSTAYTETSAATTLTSTTASGDVSFNLLGLTVSAGETKTFKVTANTSNIRTGVSSGSSVYATAMLDGSIGYDSTDSSSDGDSYWGDGKLNYFYTPVNGSENATAYTASESYDVNGNTLTF